MFHPLPTLILSLHTFFRILTKIHIQLFTVLPLPESYLLLSGKN